MFRVDLDSIREQIQDKLIDYLSGQGVELKSNGSMTFSCIMPEHEDSNPSANIIPNTKNREWKCHGCSASGDIFDAAHILEGKPIGSDEAFYQETVLYLAEKYDIEVDTGEMTDDEIHRFRARRAYQLAARIVVSQEPNELFVRALQDRQWDPQMARHCGIGQITDYGAYKQALLDADYDVDFLASIDLVDGNCHSNASWMFGPERMVFTLFDSKGRPVGFSARNLRYEEEKKEDRREKPKKYRNTRTTCLYSKQQFLYGLFGASQHPDKLVYLVEGQADVVSYQISTGQQNIVGMCGNAFTEHHVDMLKAAGLTRVCLCLDGDKAGRKKTKDIVGHTGGNPGLEVSVITLPSSKDEKDLDSFLRKHGVEGWNEAKATASTAFAWSLEHKDPEAPINQFIEFQVRNILNHQDPLRRWEMTRELSQATDTPEDVIRDKVAFHADRDKAAYDGKARALTEELQRRLIRDPGDAGTAIARYQMRRESLDKEHGQDHLGIDFQKEILRSHREREKKVTKDSGIKLGWPIFDQRTQGIPAEDTIFFVGGKANVGKTSLFANLTVDILENNKDTVVLCMTIDDSYHKYMPRLVARLTGLPTYWVTKPNAIYSDLGNNIPTDMLPRGFTSRKEIIHASDEAYRKLESWIAERRLIVVDHQMTGATWSFADRLVKQTRRDFPTSKIVLFLDNFHNLQDMGGSDNLREKFSELSELIRTTTSRERMTVFATVEYTKMQDRVKPSNTNLAESRKMEYVADGIIHLVNHMHEFRTMPGACKVYWNDQDDMETITDGEGDTHVRARSKPVVEMMFGKSKISSFKGSIYMRFDPDSCSFEEASVNCQNIWAGLDQTQQWQRG